MLLARTTLWKLGLTSLLMLAAWRVAAYEPSSAWQPPPADQPASPALGPANLQPQPPSPYNAAYPPPGQDVPRTLGGARQDWTLAPQQPSVLSTAPAAAPVERLIESTWYFRQEAFFWNERSDGQDFVKEYGPLSTVGYLHRNGCERFRLELFGGTMAYDGGAQYDDGTYEPYHDSNGTDYLGMRGEYDLLIEPASWRRLRAVVGVGTRFWIRDLHDSVTPSGNDVMGYQEDWWTFYPYIGLETREPEEPGWHFFGTARVGLTPLTYQYASAFDTALYPKCGVTGKAEFGVRVMHFSAELYFEAMTWGESAVVRDSFQPDSRMLTVGGQLGYTF